MNATERSATPLYTEKSSWYCSQCLEGAILMVFLGKTYDVSPYESQRSHPSMDLGAKWDLCVLFVQTAVKCQDCKFV